ncbi:MAG: hypothetical protein JSS62_02730 [Verrucomicrobia bacterium]|nr:hypothetical protein [Verrucomicrobiota bacterium]MBS0646443.1 hypothetical protein [Verrucomicrobiota bacterium]
MFLPQKLTDSLKKILSNYDLQHLRNISSHLTDAYRTGRWKLTQQEKLCYAICRMPATYAVIQHLTSSLEFKSLLDVGAGPGTASWVVDDQVEIVSLEHDKNFISLAQQLGSKGQWEHVDVRNWKTSQKFDLVLFSYSFGEMPDLCLQPFWQCCAQQLVIIEPGTPQGWQNILHARQQLIELGAYIWEPCAHQKACPLQQPDWCHFGMRLERSFWHRYLKQGSLDFEEEKFIYLIAGKTPKTLASRILRAPQKRTGHLHLKLCTEEGLQLLTISKKDKELYQKARQASWGETL